MHHNLCLISKILQNLIRTNVVHVLLLSGFWCEKTPIIYVHITSGVFHYMKMFVSSSLLAAKIPFNGMNSRNIKMFMRLRSFQQLSNFCKTVSVRKSHTSALSMKYKSKIIDGKKIAAQIQSEIKFDIQKWLALGNRGPHLSVVLVGDNPASAVYVNNKLKAAKKTGISSETIYRSAKTSEEEVLDIIRELNDNPNVDGILIQLPLPNHINERRVCNAIAPHKDVDGFHVVNVGRFCLDMKSLIPCTPLGIMELLRRTGIQTFGKNAVVCGRSKNVGMPMAVLLHADGIGETKAGDATVTVCHRYTPAEQLVQFTKMADILVVATGIPQLITADMVKEGATVIDVGISRIKDPITGQSKIVGDVDFDRVIEKVSYITPVPGGVGPMTVAMLMKNTYMAACSQIHYETGTIPEFQTWDADEDTENVAFVL